MKAVLRHLSGPRRGETQELEKPRILIGSAPDCDVRLAPGDAVDEQHAVVFTQDGEYYLRDAEQGHPTLVNGHEVVEIILKDGDLLEFGEGGPKLRFRLETAGGGSLRTRRVRAPGLTFPPFSLLGELGRGLSRETMPATRRVLFGGVALVVFSALLSSFVLVFGASSKRRLETELVQVRRQLAADRRSRESLQREIAEERTKAGQLLDRYEAATSGQLAALEAQERSLRDQLQEARAHASSRAQELELLKERLTATTRQIGTFDRERSNAARIIRDDQAAVALLAGSYYYTDMFGRLLRYAAMDEGGRPEKDAEGRTQYSASGTGPVVRLDYTGTGVLVSKTGMMLTNRHVAEPWWGDDDGKEMAAKGYRPRLEYLRAYFPTLADAVPLRVVRVSKTSDMALVQADLGGRQIPAVEVDRSSRAATPGQPVVLLGYPTGVDALLARLEDSVVDSIVSVAGTDQERLARELSRRGLIRPLATQGHLSDVRPNKLVYDAATTVGGSGGPIFDSQGRVIGLIDEVLTDFGGASFGVPIAHGLELMAD